LAQPDMVVEDARNCARAEDALRLASVAAAADCGRAEKILAGAVAGIGASPAGDTPMGVKFTEDLTKMIAALKAGDMNAVVAKAEAYESHDGSSNVSAFTTTKHRDAMVTTRGASMCHYSLVEIHRMRAHLQTLIGAAAASDPDARSAIRVIVKSVDMMKLADLGKPPVAEPKPDAPERPLQDLVLEAQKKRDAEHAALGRLVSENELALRVDPNNVDLLLEYAALQQAKGYTHTPNEALERCARLAGAFDPRVAAAKVILETFRGEIQHAADILLTAAKMD